MKRTHIYLWLPVALALLLGLTACRGGRPPETLPAPAEANLPLTFTPRFSVTPIPEPVENQTDASETPLLGTKCVPPDGWVPYTVKAGNNLFRLGLWRNLRFRPQIPVGNRPCQSGL